jgi:hypothetical protein
LAHRFSQELLAAVDRQQQYGQQRDLVHEFHKIHERDYAFPHNLL